MTEAGLLKSNFWQDCPLLTCLIPTLKTRAPVKLIHKFFLAFFITNISLVGMMFVFIYMNFATGFNDFVEQEEQKHVARVRQQLIAIYSEAGSWQSITENTRLWRAIVEPNRKPIKPKANQQRDNTNGLQRQAQLNNTTSDTQQQASSNHIANNLEPKPKQLPASLQWINLPEDLLRTGQRISLYDQNKQVVVGKPNLNDNSHIGPIILQNKVIGWIGLVPSRLVDNSPAKAFLTAQLHNYFMITLLVILLAFIMAIVLSRHLIKPIKQIVAGTSELNKGNFTSRIDPLTKDELGTLSHNFNELAYTLEQNQQMRFQWVSDTSHELRTPLTVLRSHLLAVQDGVFVADEKRIELLIKQVDNLNHIVDDLAQLAHSDTANLTYQAVKIDVVEVFKHTLESYTARFNEHELTVNSDALSSAGDCIVSGDQDRLQQLFANLLENTCRYTHQGGQVNIGAHTVANKVELILQDSAPGVLPEDQRQLFERFYRVEKSRSREHGGSGLGLALCKQIVEAHGGTISLHNSPLGGLEVKIVLPLAG